MPRLNLGLPFSKCDDPTCFKIIGLQRCGGCGTALFCGPAHQRANWPRHKVQCNAMIDMKKLVAKEEKKVRDKLGKDTPIPDNYCAYTPSFGSYNPPPPYLDARFNLMMAILNIRTGEAVEAALGHCLEVLRLCRGDNMGARAKAPALLLRLGRDQEAFDFIKWYAEVPANHDWNNLDLPFLDVHGADALEPFDAKTAKLIQLSWLSAMTLIKIRLMLDVTALRDEINKKGGTLTSGKKMAFLKEEATSDILLSRPDLLNKTDYDDLVADLQEQSKKMYAATKKHKKFLWPGLVNPDKFTYVIPGPYTWGSEEEAVLAFRESWYSWSECPQAVSWIRSVTQEDMRKGGYK